MGAKTLFELSSTYSSKIIAQTLFWTLFCPAFHGTGLRGQVFPSDSLIGDADAQLAALGFRPQAVAQALAALEGSAGDGEGTSWSLHVAESQPRSVAEWAVAVRFDNPRPTVHCYKCCC